MATGIPPLPLPTQEQEGVYVVLFRYAITVS